MLMTNRTIAHTSAYSSAYTSARNLLASALLACTFALPVWAQEFTVGSTKLPITSTISEQKLQLNGAGIRYKAIFKVYAAGLYLPKTAKSAEEALSMAGPKRVTMVFLRELDAKEFGKLMIAGVENNVKDKKQLVNAMPGLLKMGDIFSRYKKMNPSEEIHFDLNADKSVSLQVRGKTEAIPGGTDFYDAILLVWLGKSPVDYKLKEGMLAGGVTAQK
jgi:hypothetical protein